MASTGEKIEDYAKLWIAPSSRGFVPCVKPNPAFSRKKSTLTDLQIKNSAFHSVKLSSSTTAPGESRGYLFVSTNGGLNQMRAGVGNSILSFQKPKKKKGRRILLFEILIHCETYFM